MSKIVEKASEGEQQTATVSNEARASVCESERMRAPRAKASSNTVLKQEERDRFIHWISPILEERFGETIRTASNKVAVPIVLENGEEAYIVLSVAIPLGERAARKEDKSASSYNPYNERDNYAMECEIESEKMRAKERKEKEIAAAKEKAKNARKKARELRKAKREEEKAKLAANR